MLYQRRRIKHRIDYRLYLYIDDIPGTRGILVIEFLELTKAKVITAPILLKFEVGTRKLKKVYYQRRRKRQR
jgi:hypothetical protein